MSAAWPESNQILRHLISLAKKKKNSEKNPTLLPLLIKKTNQNQIVFVSVYSLPLIVLVAVGIMVT